MTPEQWRKITEIFDACRQVPVQERSVLIERLACDDPQIAREVAALLAVSDTGSSVLDVAPLAFAGQVLDSALRAKPDRVGEYHIDGVIGEGGMSVVYRARHTQTCRVVALKLTKPALLSTPQFTERFLTETRVVRELEHLNICRFESSGVTEEGAPWLAIEFIEGDSVTRYCERENLTARQRVELFRRICAAVQYAHDHGVLHRDIKPSNVMVDAGGVPKLLDFGIARVADEDGSWTGEATKTQFRMLTPDYASPEQLTGSKVTPSSDVYSLGVLLYELLTGRRPFTVARQTSEEFLHLISSTEPQAPAIDSKLDAIVLKALARRTVDRYASVREFDGDLAGWLDGKRVRATGELRRRRLRHTIRRHGLLSVALVAVAAAGFASWLAWRSGRPLGETPSGRPVVALLGLENRSKAGGLDWISTAFTELFSVEAPEAGSYRLVGSEQTARLRSQLGLAPAAEVSKAVAAEIARLSSARYTLTGTYEASGTEPTSGLSVTWRLADARTGKAEVLMQATGVISDVATIAWQAAHKLQDQIGTTKAEGKSAPKPPSIESLRYYSEGVDMWRKFDVLHARGLFEQAVNADPSSALAQASLSRALLQLGYDPEAAATAQRAVDLASGLPREQALAVKATACESSGASKCVVESYGALWGFFSDNPDYAISLARAQGTVGQAKDALETLEKARALHLSETDAIRADLAEAFVFEQTGEAVRELAASRRAEQTARRVKENALLAEALYFSGRGFANTGEAERALQCYQEAAKLFAAVGNRRRVLDVGNLQAVSKWNRGDLEGARVIFARLEGEAQATSNRMMQQTIAQNYGGLLKDLGDYPAARQRFETSLALIQSRGRKPQLPLALTSLADVARLEGNFPEAEQRYQRAMVVARELNRNSAIASVDLNYGDMLYLRAELESARGRYDEALALASKLKRPDFEANALMSLALVQMQADHFAEARRLARRALSTAQEAQLPTWEAYSRGALALILLEEGKAGEADQQARLAVNEFAKEGMANDEAEARGLLGVIATRLGRLDEARESSRKAAELAAKSKDPQSQMQVAQYVAVVQAAEGKRIEALGALREIEARALKSGNLAIEMETRLKELDADQGRSSVEVKRLADEARRRGFLRIARKSAMLASPRK